MPKDFEYISLYFYMFLAFSLLALPKAIWDGLPPWAFLVMLPVVAWLWPAPSERGRKLQQDSKHQTSESRRTQGAPESQRRLNMLCIYHGEWFKMFQGCSRPMTRDLLINRRLYSQPMFAEVCHA